MHFICFRKPFPKNLFQKSCFRNSKILVQKMVILKTIGVWLEIMGVRKSLLLCFFRNHFNVEDEELINSLEK